MKSSALLMLTATLFAPFAWAQQKPDEHSGHHPVVAASTAAMTEGEVRKVDKAARKLTIKHGEIKSLDMPPMTMVFLVKDTAMLDKVKAGDRIRFVAEKSDAGFVVTDLQAAK
jgi:Cu(I)/Ag(I) efflux system protein CusF